MNISRAIFAVDSHTAGEPTRIITGGLPKIPGKNMKEKKKWMSKNIDNVRKMLMWEPRGHQDMFGAIITEPTRDDCDVGLLFIHGGGYLDMCGHGSIGAVTVLLETGIINSDNLQDIVNKKVSLDTPAGKIDAIAKIDNKKVSSVSIKNVPSFYYNNTTIFISKQKSITVDIAYGGNFFALVKAKDLDVKISPKECRFLSEIGVKIRNILNESINIINPQTGEKDLINLVEIYEELPKPKNVVIFGNGEIDRSPCGTGTSAKLAMLYAKEKIDIGQEYQYESILGTKFFARIVEETSIGEYNAVIPEITGSAYITSFSQYVISNDDPFKYGFELYDNS